MKTAPLAEVKALLARSRQSIQAGQGLTSDDFWRTVKQRTDIRCAECLPLLVCRVLRLDREELVRSTVWKRSQKNGINEREHRRRCATP